MQIQIIPQVIIPEMEMIEPKVAVKIYNAKTWRDREPDRGEWVPPIHLVTTMGVVVGGCSSWCATGVYVDERLVYLYSRSVAIARPINSLVTC